MTVVADKDLMRGDFAYEEGEKIKLASNEEVVETGVNKAGEPWVEISAREIIDNGPEAEDDIIERVERIPARVEE